MHSKPLLLRTCSVDLITGLVNADTRTDQLHETELRLLNTLVAQPNVAISRADLYLAVWGRSGGKSRVLDVTIARIRRKLEALPDRPEHLITEFGVGYRFRTLQSANERPTEPVRFDRFDELSLIGSWFSEGQRMVSLSGPPHSGKTTLANMVMALHGDRRSRVKVSMEGVHSAVAAESRMATTLRPILEAGFGGRFLLVLDDVEFATDALVGVIHRWMSRFPTLDVLTVGRCPLPDPRAASVALSRHARPRRQERPFTDHFSAAS